MSHEGRALLYAAPPGSASFARAD